MAPGEGKVPHKERYALDPKPLGRGGFAEVFRATRRTDGLEVALKRPRRVSGAVDRLRREIEVQRGLAHPNIMPIWDADPGGSWFTMPIAEGNLEALRDDLDEDDLSSILLHVADALEVAHSDRLIHRDISPGNILALPSSGNRGRRWVVADWGLVRRPAKGSSTPLTRVGQGMGTEGFAAPEIWQDATQATEAADVYSLGRVAAWFLTRTRPRADVMLLPDGDHQHWRSFIRACTESDLDRRLATMGELRARLSNVFALQDETPAVRARRLVEEIVLGGGAQQLVALVTLASDHEGDTAIFIDHLARVPSAQLRTWVLSSSEQAANLACTMARHVCSSPWEDRDLEYVGTPLAFVYTVLQALVEAGQVGLAEDVAEDFFAAEVKWRHEPQRLRTVEWLADLDGAAADAMARAIRGRNSIQDYYRQSATWTCRSAHLAKILKV
ncbi:serine/threonine-protein kinase [Nonomuraea sp. NPDC026600]|uniref:serine/threonine-protein kinase n=1 Tax=Nonomuraea sp. NPDC026600 TaxID=3155363 RepID=UPI00340B6574